MKRTRAAYWREFKKMAIDTKIAKELPEYQIIELSVPVSIPVRWKKRVTRKEGKVWREYQGLAEYQPGQVLHREWRRASSWEVEEWNEFSSEALEALGVFKRNGEYFIQIVEKIKDLRAAVRQRCRHILGEIRRAREQQKPWQLPVQASQYEIASSSLELAEKWFRLTRDIEQRFGSCYQRLGQLGQELQEKMLQGEEVSLDVLFLIAREADGIRQYLLKRIPNFEPYYSRLQEPEFQRLSRVLEHAEQRRAKTVYNDIEKAKAKLEAMAIGEKPAWAEISRQI